MVCSRCEWLTDLAIESLHGLSPNTTDLIAGIKVLRESDWNESDFSRSELLIAAELLSARPEIVLKQALCVRMNISESNVRVIVSRVRAKAPEGWAIATFPGIGWRLEAPGEEPDPDKTGHYMSAGRKRKRKETLGETLGLMERVS